MEANVRKELDVLISKVLDWRKSYLTLVSGKNDECLIDDLRNDIDIWMAPYVFRLEQTKHITRQESNDFWTVISKNVDEFIKDVKAGKRITQKVIIDIDKLLSQFKIHKDLIEGNHINHEFQIEQKVKLANIAMILILALAEKQGICSGECGSCRISEIK